MGFDPTKIRTISLAAEEGLGVGDLNKIEVQGASIEGVMQKFENPQSARAKMYPGVNFIDDKACSACEGEFHSPLFYMSMAGLMDRLKGLTVVMGEQKSPPKIGDKMILVGECVREFKNLAPFIDGCPPRGWALTRKVCEVCGINEKSVIPAIEKVHGKLSEIG